MFQFRKVPHESFLFFLYKYCKSYKVELKWPVIFDSVWQALAKLYKEQHEGRTDQSRAEHKGSRLIKFIINSFC